MRLTLFREAENMQMVVSERRRSDAVCGMSDMNDKKHLS